MFYAFSDKLPHRGISVSSFIESVSAPILRLLFPSDLEQKRNITKKIQLLTDVSELEKEEQTKKEVKIEKKKTEEEKAKEIRKRALENLNPRKDENVVGR